MSILFAVYLGTRHWADLPTISKKKTIQSIFLKKGQKQRIKKDRWLHISRNTYPQSRLQSKNFTSPINISKSLSSRFPGTVRKNKDAVTTKGKDGRFPVRHENVSLLLCLKVTEIICTFMFSFENIFPSTKPGKAQEFSRPYIRRFIILY